MQLILDSVTKKPQKAHFHLKQQKKSSYSVLKNAFFRTHHVYTQNTYVLIFQGLSKFFYHESKFPQRLFVISSTLVNSEFRNPVQKGGIHVKGNVKTV